MPQKLNAYQYPAVSRHVIGDNYVLVNMLLQHIPIRVSLPLANEKGKNKLKWHKVKMKIIV
jgi:hypothetical protein